MTVVFLFPGQSSRDRGMLDRAVELHRPNADLIERASELLGTDLAAHYRTEDAFARNVDVQIGVFLANHLFLQAIQARGVDAPVSLGLSLGEWNHLVHIGTLSFESALLAVRARGEAYDAGPRGWMAAVQPIPLEELEEVLASLRHLGTLEAVNLNSPTQHVIAGAQEAVEAAVAILEEEHFTQPRIIERSVPMHSSLFRPVGDRFRHTLETLPFRPPCRPYLPNRRGGVLEDPRREDFVELLATHVHAPVLWRRSIDEVRVRWPDCVFVEVGPRKVLHDLLQRKWSKRPRMHTDSLSGHHAHLDSVVARVSQPGGRARA